MTGTVRPRHLGRTQITGQRAPSPSAFTERPQLSALLTNGFSQPEVKAGSSAGKRPDGLSGEGHSRQLGGAPSTWWVSAERPLCERLCEAGWDAAEGCLPGTVSAVPDLRGLPGNTEGHGRRPALRFLDARRQPPPCGPRRQPPREATERTKHVPRGGARSHVNPSPRRPLSGSSSMKWTWRHPPHPDLRRRWLV